MSGRLVVGLSGRFKITMLLRGGVRLTNGSALAAAAAGRAGLQAAPQHQQQLLGLGARRGFQAVASLKGKHLMSIDSLTDEELKGLLDLSADLKRAYTKKGSTVRPLAGKSISMIFQKRSTRTRVSTETGMAMLGGHALFLGPQDIQLGVNETLKDTAYVLSRFNSLILARVFGHRDVETLAHFSAVPVINALSDLHHPLQALADMQTLQEHFGAQNLAGKTVAWVGDGNNVLHDLALAAARLGMNVRVACPVGYDPDGEVMASVKRHAERNGRTLTMTRKPTEAVKGAHVVVTDTWVSMGQEEEYERRVKDFEGYQVTDQLMAKADPSAVFLHCLPRHEEEVADEVFYSKRSLVFPEAENRMWTVMAVMLSLAK